MEIYLHEDILKIIKTLSFEELLGVLFYLRQLEILATNLEYENWWEYNNKFKYTIIGNILDFKNKFISFIFEEITNDLELYKANSFFDRLEKLLRKDTINHTIDKLFEHLIISIEKLNCKVLIVEWYKKIEKKIEIDGETFVIVFDVYKEIVKILNNNLNG